MKAHIITGALGSVVAAIVIAVHPGMSPSLDWWTIPLFGIVSGSVSAIGDFISRPRTGANDPNPKSSKSENG